MPGTVDVIIVGAGPYGLSLASHLHAKGVRFRIFGKSMDNWKDGMPPGMRLKSHAWSSSLSDPRAELTFPVFCAEAGLPIGDADTPPLDVFIDYAEAFQKRFVPNVEPKLLTHLRKDSRGFEAEFEDGEVLLANKVILAVGIHPFKYVPEALGGLPKQVVSHSADGRLLDFSPGESVAVIGAGASATDWAALLAERNVSVSLIARAPELKFSQKPRARRSAWRRAASVLKPVLLPGSGIGAGWVLKFCADAPWAFRILPRRMRKHVVRTQLGPLGHSAMKDRIVGKMPLYLGRDLTGSEFVDGKVHLHLTKDGREDVVVADHVIAATGYRIDVRRLGFLDETLLSGIATSEGAPVLSMNYESSQAGLHFIGVASADSFGPVMRFVFGASHPCRRLAAHLAHEMEAAERRRAQKIWFSNLRNRPFKVQAAQE